MFVSLQTWLALSSRCCHAIRWYLDGLLFVCVFTNIKDWYDGVEASLVIIFLTLFFFRSWTRPLRRSNASSNSLLPGLAPGRGGCTDPRLFKPAWRSCCRCCSRGTCVIIRNEFVLFCLLFRCFFFPSPGETKRKRCKSGKGRNANGRGRDVSSFVIPLGSS